MSAGATRQGQGCGVLRLVRRDERGAAMVEYAATMALFFLLFFAILDFGRLLYNWVMAEKATQMAARIATVRPAVCTGVPDMNSRGSGSTPEDRFGVACDSRDNICAGQAAPTQTCDGDDAGIDAATGGEIWGRISELLPPGAAPGNVKYSYTFDPELNFLGGPYVPMVTVEVQNLTFQFASPLLGLGKLAAGKAAAGATTYGDIPFPSMSVSLPGEDLALGTGG